MFDFNFGCLYDVNSKCGSIECPRFATTGLLYLAMIEIEELEGKLEDKDAEIKFLNNYIERGGVDYSVWDW